MNLLKWGKAVALMLALALLAPSTLPAFAAGHLDDPKTNEVMLPDSTEF